MGSLTPYLMAKSNNRPNQFELGGEPIEPCPFCGSDHIVFTDEFEGKDWFRLQCFSCGACGPCRMEKRFSLKAWQQRAKIIRNDGAPPRAV